MNGEKQFERGDDWELSEDFYQADENNDLKLEDFMEPDQPAEAPLSPGGGLLEKTAGEVKAVMALYGQHKSISEIASSLGFEESYVTIILQCAQGYQEDDAIAVAHLVMMSL